MKAADQGASGAPPDEETPASLGLAVSLALTGPVVSLVDLSVRFFLVEFGFAKQHEGIVLAIGAASCLAALSSSLLSHRVQRRARGRAREVEFVSAIGVALGALAAIVIVAALLPHLYFDGEVAP